MLLRLADGETITALQERDVVILADRPGLAITWSRYAAGEPGPGLHVHRHHTDAFYVLAGELTFAVGPRAQRISVPAGSFVAVPPNVVHTFANDSAAEARWLNLHAPDAGFADYLRALRDGTAATFDSVDPPADGGLPASGAVVAGPGDGDPVDCGGPAVALMGALPDLSFAAWAFDGPSDGPGLEPDTDRQHAYYVLDGEIEITVARTVHAAGPDAIVCVPPGVGHAVAHRGAGTARAVSVHAQPRAR